MTRGISLVIERLWHILVNLAAYSIENAALILNVPDQGEHSEFAIISAATFVECRALSHIELE